MLIGCACLTNVVNTAVAAVGVTVVHIDEAMMPSYTLTKLRMNPMHGVFAINVDVESCCWLLGVVAGCSWSTLL